MDEAEVEVNHAIGAIRPIMSLIGLWPHLPRFCRLIQNVAFLVISVMYIGLTLADLYLTPRDMFDTVNTVVIFGLSFEFQLKYFALLAYFPRYKTCLLALESDWRNVESDLEKEIMHRYAARGRLYNLLCVFLHYSTSCTYNALPFLRPLLFSTQPEGDSCSLPLTMWQPFDVCSSPNYEITYFVQVVTNLYYGSATVVVDGFIVSLVLHAIAQFEILSKQLENMGTNDPTLRLSVERHMKVLRLAEDLKASFHLAAFCHFAGSVSVLCLAGFSFVESISRRDALQVFISSGCFFGTSFQLFLYCTISEELYEKSQQVSNAIYNSPWYERNVTQQKYLILLMIRSLQSKRMAAGKFVELSMANFGSVLKTTAAYMSVLRSLR